MGPTVSRFSTAKHPTDYAVPRICGYLSRLSAVHSWCGPLYIGRSRCAWHARRVQRGVPRSVGRWQTADELRSAVTPPPAGEAGDIYPLVLIRSPYSGCRCSQALIYGQSGRTCSPRARASSRADRAIAPPTP
jgi:hypothetical protein